MYKQLSQIEAKNLIAERETVILDVRDEDSYKKAHIDDAKHLTVAELQIFCETVDPKQPILVYCYHGISSQSVAQHLVEEGFREVYSLIGGFEAWKAAHSPSE